MRSSAAGRRRSFAALAFAAVVLLSGCMGTTGVGDVDEVLYPDDGGSVSAQTTADEAASGEAEPTDDAESEATESTTEAAETAATTTPGTTSSPTTVVEDSDAAPPRTESSSSGSTSGGSAGSSSGPSTPADDPTTTEADDPPAATETDDQPAADCDRDVTRDDQAVRVLTCEVERNDDGSVTVSGTVENAGDVEVYDPGVYVRPYDVDGEMIQEGAYELYGRDLPAGPLDPGDTADYSVTFEDGDAIDDYEVAGFDDVEAGPYESDRNVYWKTFDDERREADDVLVHYTHQDSNGLVVYGQAEYVHDLRDITYTVTVETDGETVEKQIDAGDADEDGEVTFAVYLPDVTDEGYDVRVTGHGHTEPQDE